MSDQLIGGVVTVATAIIGVAIIAVLVSNRAQTSQVIQSAGSAFSAALGTAEAPVTGQGSFGNLNIGNIGSY